MDRIDLRIEVPAVTAVDLILPPPAEGSAEVAARLAAARDVQIARDAAWPQALCKVAVSSSPSNMRARQSRNAYRAKQSRLRRSQGCWRCGGFFGSSYAYTTSRDATAGSPARSVRS